MTDLNPTTRQAAETLRKAFEEGMDGPLFETIYDDKGKRVGCRLVFSPKHSYAPNLEVAEAELKAGNVGRYIVFGDSVKKPSERHSADNAAATNLILVDQALEYLAFALNSGIRQMKFEIEEASPFGQDPESPTDSEVDKTYVVISLNDPANEDVGNNSIAVLADHFMLPERQFVADLNNPGYPNE